MGKEDVSPEYAAAVAVLPPVESTPLALLRFRKDKVSERLLAAITERLRGSGVIVLDAASDETSCVLSITTTQNDLEETAEIMRMVKPTLPSQTYGRCSILEEFTVVDRDRFVEKGRPYPFSSADRVRLCLNVWEYVRVLDDDGRSSPLTTLLDDAGIKYRAREDDDENQSSRSLLEDTGRRVGRSGSALNASSPLSLVLSSHDMLESVTPVHAVAEREALLRHCWDPRTSVPVDEIRNYYGEEVAFYFCWLEFFQRWLRVPAVVGLAIYAHRTYTGATVRDCSLTPFFGVFVFVWASLFTRSWDQLECRKAHAWGTFAATDTAKSYYPLRPGFHGELRVSPVTGLLERYYSPNKRRAQYAVSAAVTGLMILCAFCYMVVSLNLQGYIQPDDDEFHPFHLPFFAQLSEEGQMFDKDDTIRGMIPTVLHSIVISFLNGKYREIATVLTEWENHETAIDHENSLILKRFFFESFDSYNALFYLAFFEANITKLRGELISLFYIDTFRRLLTECLIPMALRYKADRDEKQAAGKTKKDDDAQNDDDDDERRKSALLESTLEPYEEFDDYLEMVLTFGYVTLFASAYPLAAAVVVLGYPIELRCDVTKIARVNARARPFRTDNIGTWKTVIKALVLMSAITNCLIFSMTSSQMANFFPDYVQMTEEGEVGWVAGKGWIIVFVIFGIERALLLVYATVQSVMPRVPEDVQDKVERCAYVQQQEALQERHAKRNRQIIG